MSLTRIGIQGAYFTSMALAARQVISLATTFYVARQLQPSDMGLFAMVMVVIGLAQVIGDIGIATGLIRTQANSSTVLSTCFWISAGLGLAVSLAVFLLAPLATLFYEKQELLPYLRGAAIGLLVNFLMPVPMALMQQRLAYKLIALSQAAGSFTGAIATVGLVYLNAGIWALVLQPIIGNFVTLCLLLIFTKWLPSFQFQISSSSDIIKSGVNLLGSGLVGYFRNNFDSLIIGKSFPAQSLGFYGMAQQILYAPMYLITSTVTRVLFPLLAKVQSEPERLRDAVLAATNRTALLVFPLYFGLLILTEELVSLVFGLKWMPMVPLIRIMAIAYMVSSIGCVSGPLMLTLNRAREIFILSMFNALIYLGVLLLAIPYGLTPVVVGYAITNSVLGILSLGASLYFAKIGMVSYIANIARPLMYSSLMGIVVYLMKIYLIADSMVGFMVAITAGCCAYLAQIYLFEKATWNQVASIFRS